MVTEPPGPGKKRVMTSFTLTSNLDLQSFIPIISEYISPSLYLTTKVAEVDHRGKELPMHKLMTLLE